MAGDEFYKSRIRVAKLVSSLWSLVKYTRNSAPEPFINLENFRIYVFWARSILRAARVGLVLLKEPNLTKKASRDLLR